MASSPSATGSPVLSSGLWEGAGRAAVTGAGQGWAGQNHNAGRPHALMEWGGGGGGGTVSVQVLVDDASSFRSEPIRYAKGEWRC